MKQFYKLALLGMVGSTALTTNSVLAASGDVTRVGGSYDFTVNIDNLEDGIKRDWGILGSDKYRTKIEGCGSSGSGGSKTLYFSATVDGVSSQTADAQGFLPIDEYLAIKPIVSVSQRDHKYLAPFYNRDNGDTKWSCSVFQNPGINTGKFGDITIKVLKPFLQGEIHHKIIIKVYGRWGNQQVNLTEPLTVATININSIKIKEACTINNGNIINVDLGPMSVGEIQRNEIQKPFDVSIDCKGGNFDKNIPTPMKIKFDSDNVFPGNTNYFGTQQQNLGIKLGVLSPFSAELNRGQFYPFTLPESNHLNFNMTAQPVIKGGEVHEGDFSSSGYILLEYQ